MLIEFKDNFKLITIRILLILKLGEKFHNIVFVIKELPIIRMTCMIGRLSLRWYSDVAE